MLKIKKTFLIIVALFLPIFSVLAQQLEKIPGQTSVGDSDLIGYLNNLYKFGISITGILAVFMIAVGAFSYIVTSAGNPSKMSDAKSKITNALIGLTIALTAYLFLYVINPDLVKGTLNAPTTAIETVENPPVGLPNGTPCSHTLAGGGFSDPHLTKLCSDCIGGETNSVTIGSPMSGHWKCGSGWDAVSELPGPPSATPDSPT